MTEALLLVGDSESNQNLYYRTHFLAGDPFVYLENTGRNLLVVSPMERGRAEKESIVPEVKTFDDFGYRDLVKEHGDSGAAFPAMLLRILGDEAATVRVEATFPVLYADALRAAGAQLSIDAKLLRLERRSKSAEEIAAIETAQRATERAVAHAIDILGASDSIHGFLQYNGIPLTSERLRAEIELSLTRDGMDPGSVIAAGGPAAADPHFAGAGPLREGESIVIDVFPRSKTTRYYSDMTRTVVRGEPGDQLRAMYDAVIRAQEAALAAIHAGANGKDVHKAADDVFVDAGFGDTTGPRYIHSTGHGVGLDIHEAPGLGSLDVELIEGDVVTVEPGLYDPEVGAVRIEDIVVVTADGYRNLTRFPKQFQV